MANAALNTMIDSIRELDTTFPGSEGDTVAIVTAIVAETLADMASGADDPRIEGGLVLISMLASRVESLHQLGEIEDEPREFALDLCLEFSLALCRLHS